MTDAVPADSSGEDFERILKELPTVPGGTSVTREVRKLILGRLLFFLTPGGEVYGCLRRLSSV